MWNGTAETLKASPIATRTSPMISPFDGFAPPANNWASPAKLVVPVKP